MTRRMRSILSVLLVGLAGLVTAGHAAEEPARGGDRDELARGNNRFALDLYGGLMPTEGNLFFSPFSVSTALAMTYGGARGATRAQMAETLHFTLEPDRLHRAFGDLLRHFADVQDKGIIQLHAANALWPQKGYPLLPQYLELTRRHYDAEPIAVDFQNACEEARLLINRWVEIRTNDKIRELIMPGVLTPAARLVLTNAVYFKGNWAGQFNRSLTRESPFWLSPGSAVPLALMNGKQNLAYAETEACQILRLPYEGNDLSMIVILPRQVDGLAGIEEKLTQPSLDRWLSGLEKKDVVVFLPKFKLTRQLDLGRLLAAMGMPEAFGPRADFSGMDGTTDLVLSAALHKAFVEVGEEGTEAAAATGVVMRLKSVSAPSPVFRADHPFLFLIRDDKTGSILFMGRFVRPDP